MSRIAKVFHVSHLQILNEHGKCDEKLMPKLESAEIKRLYELMVLSRQFDETAIKLQREGRLGTYASGYGQEAVGVGSAFVLNEADWLFPSFRDSAALITRGYPMSMILQYWGGDERGMKAPDNLNIFPIAVPVATQIPHAVGAAWGMKLKGKKTAALVYFGDGATSKADFHEAMNFAGVFKTPCIFVCENNQWAISVPVSKQTASETIAQKAIAYGFEGIQVDGNDIFAVIKATQEALKLAKNGKEATLLECVTYRLADHTTSDDASRYRSQAEVDAWKAKEPIERLRKWMERKGLWNEDYGKSVENDAKEKISKAVDDYLKEPLPSPEDIIKYTYAETPWNLKEQLKQVIAVIAAKQKNDNEEKRVDVSGGG